MLTSSFAAAAVDYYTHAPYFSLFCGLVVGMLTMGMHAFLTIQAKADAIVSAVAVNIFAAGLTPVLSKALFGSATNTPSIPLEARIRDWHFLPEPFDQSPLIYVALAIPFALHFLLYRTGWGLRILGVGDGPAAVETSGVSVKRTRYLALLLGGAIASLGGTYLSISHASQFTRDMTAGRGYIALAAVIFGKWRPLPTFFACLFFGLADALQIRLQNLSFFGVEMPVQFIQAFPYLVTLLVLVGFMGKSRPPLAIGKRE